MGWMKINRQCQKECGDSKDTWWKRMIHQGDIYWIDPGQPIGSEPAYIHP
jgi:hypothetical protein